MIKNLFLFFWALALFATLSQAQVSSVTGQYLQDNNLLLNPGFESGIGKWTNSAGTFTADYSVFVQGKASGKVVLSSQNMDFYQDSTLFASQLADGMQAILTVKIKSNVAGVRVCPRQAGVVITSLCVSVQGNDKWGLYQIPFVTGATSQGISINSNSTSITGTVYVDESYVGVSNILNSSSEAKLAGEAYFAGTTGCTWARTSTTIGAFGTVAACPGPTIVSQNLGSWQTTDSDLPRITVNNLPAGTYKATFSVQTAQTTASANNITITDGTTSCTPTIANPQSSSTANHIVYCVFNYSSAGNKSFELNASSAANTIQIDNTTATGAVRNTKFILEYYGSNSTYTTTAGINNVDVFSAKVSAAGVVSEENVNWINGNASVSTGIYTYTLNSGIVSNGMNCLAGSASNAAPNQAIDCTVTSSSSSQVVVRCSQGGTNVSFQHSLICQKQGADFVASKTITGSFNEVMTTPGISKPKTCYYAFGGTGNLSAPTSCTTSPCTTYLDSCGSLLTTFARASAGDYSATSNGWASSSLIICNASIPGGSFAYPVMTFITNSSGQSTVRVRTGSTLTDSSAIIKCEGISP